MTNETERSKFVYPKIENFVKPSDFKDKKLSGRILNAFTNIPNQIYREDAEDAENEWVSIYLDILLAIEFFVIDYQNIC